MATAVRTLSLLTGALVVGGGLLAFDVQRTHQRHQAESIRIEAEQAEKAKIEAEKARVAEAARAEAEQRAAAVEALRKTFATPDTADEDAFVAGLKTGDLEKLLAAIPEADRERVQAAQERLRQKHELELDAKRVARVQAATSAGCTTLAELASDWNDLKQVQRSDGKLFGKARQALRKFERCRRKLIRKDPKGAAELELSGPLRLTAK